MSTIFPRAVAEASHSKALQGSAAKQVRAHALHTPHGKLLIQKMNRYDPSSGQRTSGATSHSFG
jgi:hypothetical protein